MRNNFLFKHLLVHVCASELNGHSVKHFLEPQNATTKPSLACMLNSWQPSNHSSSFSVDLVRFLSSKFYFRCFFFISRQTGFKQFCFFRLQIETLNK